MKTPKLLLFSILFLTLALTACGSIIVQQEENRSTTGEATPSPPTTAAQAGHWEGEPSVSFDVTAEGDIRDFKIRAPFGYLSGQYCTIEAERVTVGPEGEFTMGEPKDAPFYFTGKFTDPTHLTGSYKIAVCSDGENASVVLEPQERSWNAVWQGPNAAQAPEPTETETPAPTEAVLVVTVTPPVQPPTWTPAPSPTPTAPPAATTAPSPSTGAWQPISDLPRAVNALAADPADPRVIYAGTGQSGAGSGVYKSGDGGQTWTSASDGLPSEDVKALASGQTAPPTLYAAAGNDFFASADGGASWSHRAHGVGNWRGFEQVEVAPGNGQLLYAVAVIEGVFRSDDGGINWLAVNQGLPEDSNGSFNAQALAIDPTDGSVVYLGTGWHASHGNGVYKSTDGGATWVPANRGMTDFSITALAVDPSRPGTVYAGTYDGNLFKSEDGAASWRDLTDRLPQQETIRSAVQAILVDPEAPERVYLLGERQGILSSDDAGETWRLVGKPGALDHPSFRALAVFFDPQPVLVAGTQDQGGWLYGTALPEPTPEPAAPAATSAPVVATPRPGSWQAIPDLPRQINALAMDPRNPRLLYAGTGSTGTGSGVYKSEDAGVTWQLAAAGLPSEDVRALAFGQADPSMLYAAVGHGELYASTDGAASWTHVSHYGLTGFQARMVVAPGEPDLIFIAEDVRGVYRSVDGGQNWTSIGEGLPQDADGAVQVQALTVDPADAGVVYAGTGWGGFGGNGVYRSTDGGATWAPANRGMIDRSVTALAIHPQQPQTLFAGTNEGELFHSADGGETWRSLATNLAEQNAIRQIVIDPTQPGTVYLLFERLGLLVSYDGGESWRLLGKPGTLEYPSFTVLALVPGPQPVLVVGAREEGGWRYAAP